MALSDSNIGTGVVKGTSISLSKFAPEAKSGVGEVGFVETVPDKLEGDRSCNLVAFTV